MRRRTGDVLVIGEERFGDEVFPSDGKAEHEEVAPEAGERGAAAEVPARVAARLRAFVAGRRRMWAALGCGALVAVAAAWLVAGLGGLERPSSAGSDPRGAVPLVGQRPDAQPGRGHDSKGAGATRRRRRSSDEAPSAGEPEVEAPTPTPAASVSPAPPPPAPDPTVPTETADPPRPGPTAASAATVQREFGP